MQNEAQLEKSRIVLHYKEGLMAVSRLSPPAKDKFLDEFAMGTRTRNRPAAMCFEECL